MKSASFGNAPNATYIFGDFFVNTGNAGPQGFPYGMIWLRYPVGWTFDGQNQADFFGKHTSFILYYNIIVLII